MNAVGVYKVREDGEGERGVPKYLASVQLYIRL